MTYDLDLAARKAALFAEQTAAAPHDPRVEADTARHRELSALRGHHGSLTPDEQAEYIALRARLEAAASARAEARREAERAAAAAHAEARREAAAAQVKARVRVTLRAAFVGTDAEFAERWPALWARYRDRLALDAATTGGAATLAEKRRQLGGL